MNRAPRATTPDARGLLVRAGATRGRRHAPAAHAVRPACRPGAPEARALPRVTAFVFD